MGFVNSQKVLLSSLSLVVGLFGINVLAAIAGTFSINNIALQISRKTTVPILLPSEKVIEENKFEASETIYSYLESSSNNGYNLTFNNQPGNVGNAAFRFSISASRGKDFERQPSQSDPKYAAKYSQVKIFANSSALVTTWCGGSACWSTVQWKSNGVLYKVTSKRRQSDAALAIANSAIKSGNRNP
jgi:hypothetical protein